MTCSRCGGSCVEPTIQDLDAGLACARCKGEGAEPGARRGRAPQGLLAFLITAATLGPGGYLGDDFLSGRS